MMDEGGFWPKWFVNLIGGKKRIQSLKKEEQALVYKYPFEARSAQKSSNIALRKTAQLFSNSSDGTRANAFQHAYWNALMTYQIGAAKAKLFATAHESYTEAELNAVGIGGISIRILTEMDLHNNDVGRKIGGAYQLFLLGLGKRGSRYTMGKVTFLGTTIWINDASPERDLAIMTAIALESGLLTWVR